MLCYLRLLLFQLGQKVQIPPTVVGGLIQVPSTDRLLNRLVIPPTAVGGYFKFSVRKHE
jgi:hypothetical protein